MHRAHTDLRVADVAVSDSLEREVRRFGLELLHHGVSRYSLISHQDNLLDDGSADGDGTPHGILGGDKVGVQLGDG